MHRPIAPLLQAAQMLEASEQAPARLPAVLALLREAVSYDDCGLLFNVPPPTLPTFVGPTDRPANSAMAAMLGARLALLIEQEQEPPGASPSASATARRASLTVPLVSLGRVLGVLSVERDADSPYEATDLRLLALFASQIGGFVAAITAEEALRASEQYLRTFLESLPQLVWTFRADGSCNYLSRQWIEFTGIPEADQLGYGWASQLHPEDWPWVQTSWAESVKTGAPYDVEIRIRRADGIYRWFKTRATPLRAIDERIVTWVGSCTDIDDLKGAEAEISRLNAALASRVDQLDADLALRVAELKRSNVDLERFAYTVSHDLKAPLVSIQGFAQELVDDYGARLDEAGQHYLARIVANIERLDGLIDDLLNFSRVARSSAVPASVDLGELTGRVLDTLQDLCTRSGATVRVARPLPFVLASPLLLEQILANLLTNAFTYGAIPGEAPDVEIGYEDRGARWRVFVRDRGFGIPLDQQEWIFGLFERLAAGKAINPRGTGVGLSIVRKAAETMGGEAGVDSAPGAGACFWVDVPKMPGRHRDIGRLTGSEASGLK